MSIIAPVGCEESLDEIFIEALGCLTKDVLS